MLGIRVDVIAFSALVIGAAILEINDKPVSGLWLVIALWLFLTDFF